MDEIDILILKHCPKLYGDRYKNRQTYDKVRKAISEAQQQVNSVDLADVVGQSEQLTCECVGLGSTEVNKINDKWICCECNRPLAG
jgi:hypothetical protein